MFDMVLSCAFIVIRFTNETTSHYRYHVTEQLNEKSYVYSFWVVLLERITGKNAIVICQAASRMNLIQWVIPKFKCSTEVIWTV